MPHLNRRRLLAALAAAPAGGLSLALTAQAQSAGLITGSVCSVQAETTAGPFYVDPSLVRSDIAEDRPGAPTTMRLQVVTAACQPIPGARVDIWHCDAQGVYSAVLSALADARGTVFLRGTQFTDANGVATFRSIFPGWYPGRAPHVHYMVFLDDRTVLTSQFFFPESALSSVYQGHPAYGRGIHDMGNARDGIARRAGPAAVAAVAGDEAELRADLVVAVRG